MRRGLMISAAACVMGAQAALAQMTPITDELLQNPPESDWLSYGHGPENYRHSPLTQITPENVGSLQLVWARGMEPQGMVQSAPLVADGVLYLPNPGDVIQAIDAATGDLIWEHRRQLPDTTVLNTIGERKRGVALYGDNLLFMSWDNHLVALNRESGQVVYDIDRGQGDERISNSTGPFIANGVVVAGSTCQYSAFGCYVTGHDANTGEELWRNYFIPRPGEEGDETWGNDYESRWMTGAWGQVSYDPVTNLVYYGSSAVGPASEAQRGTPGGTLHGTNTRFAVRPDTGEIVWQHQTLPRDNWDQECTFEMLPVSTNVNPAADMDGVLAINPNAATGERRVLTGVPCKTGTLWQFDAETGEFLWARDTNLQNLIESVDPETGIVTVNEDVVHHDATSTVAMCPTYLGGRDWPTTAFNPSTGVIFVPLNNMCADSTPVDDDFSALDVYNTDLVYHLAPGFENIGRIDAIDVSTGNTLWSYEQPEGLYAPVTSTAGGLLFTGGSDRRFKAISQDTGEVLWSARLSTGISGHPISFAVDGRQYVAVAGGGSHYGTRFNTPVGLNIDATMVGSALWVFALPEG
ncbi:pyrroloquinoline quinone-dependent dehydrogenase [Ketogulonicigenium vulgare]|uniref:Precursor of SSDA1 n=1 Tax=Ketogulonicigenium vulgare (strain WSH-001) TaxID=759362 RepID=F9YBB0_KETVW|nr:PQQ-binding-like beta-propeller repeat protein [Ketogulonicigenium vulgare]ADO44138.1 sorbose dehydrogenase [Ketogulonicigenium vulgare Y25]AEM42662.1 Precursor of SSDA1 [Ketogulonicigenium vulgare WSH-001]ALJ82467.1 ATP-binding protein [Ketogulonicigenium vulgare]ANW35251.1 ATP-binding protein [Ketogulonicigenium vulgare]AOZ53363.1 sorbose dehydrogenase [Ketogulonicigenium vulgare]